MLLSYSSNFTEVARTTERLGTPALNIQPGCESVVLGQRLSVTWGTAAAGRGYRNSWFSAFELKTAICVTCFFIYIQLTQNMTVHMSHKDEQHVLNYELCIYQVCSSQEGDMLVYRFRRCHARNVEKTSPHTVLPDKGVQLCRPTHFQAGLIFLR
jgi:hypothetical protein